ncbi:MAG: hypothetical protein ACP5KJ_00380 [Candidatus Micrarchaeia archaeon]
MQKISNDELAYMRAFYEITKVEPIYCISSQDGVAFLVPTGSIGKAVGKSGANIALLRKRFDKGVYVFENINSEEEFIKKSINVQAPVIMEDKKNNKKVILVKLSTPDRYAVRRGAVMAFSKRLFQRLFGKELKVIV